MGSRGSGSGGSGPAARAVAAVAARAEGWPVPDGTRVTVSLHPGRVTRDGEPLLAALARDGRLRSQFATGTSNGGLTAHPGGDRWRWESRLFDTAYDDAPAEDRPVYGALDTTDPASSRGAAPRFGSAFLRLHPAVLARTTCCFPDSHLDPVDAGTAATAGRLLALAASGGCGAGAAAPDRPPGRTTDGPGGGVSDPLDRYVEAQVHGPVWLNRDVEALVLDPAFRGTAVEHLARALPCPLGWHTGWRLDLAVLRAAGPAYRGPAVVAAGEALAVAGVLDARALDRGTARDVDPQTLKQLWHCVARFGRQAG